MINRAETMINWEVWRFLLSHSNQILEQKLEDK